jgi:hypothetical protein
MPAPMTDAAPVDSATDSAQLNRWIDQAKALGLVVTIEDTGSLSSQQWSVTIRRPQVVAVTALDDYNNRRGLHLLATRSAAGVRWRHGAYRTGITWAPIAKLSVVRYAIEGLADDLPTGWSASSADGGSAKRGEHR